MKTSPYPDFRRRGALRFFITMLGLLATLAWLQAERVASDENTTQGALPPLSFTMKDQFGREYTEAYCAGKVSVLMIYDREGGVFGERWGAAIGAGLRATAQSPTAQWINVTTLTGIPTFLRRTAGKYLPRDPARWTLLDWEGHLSKTYAISPHHLGILVCGPDGRVAICRSVRELDPAVVSSIVAAIVNTDPATVPPGAGGE